MGLSAINIRCFLRRNGFKTALELRDAPEEWIRKKMTVKGQRLLSELKGKPALEWEFAPAAKKNICTSRSFGTLQSKKSVIKEALCNYADSSVISKYALKALDIVYKDGYNYLKCGVIVMDLVPDNQVQGNLFNNEKLKARW